MSRGDAFVSDDDAALIAAACDRVGAGSLVAAEVIAALTDARSTVAAVGLLLEGRLSPRIENGHLRWDLSDAARAELRARIAPYNTPQSAPEVP